MDMDDDASVGSGPAAKGRGKTATKPAASRGKKSLVSRHVLADENLHGTTLTFNLSVQ